MFRSGVAASGANCRRPVTFAASFGRLSAPRQHDSRRNPRIASGIGETGEKVAPARSVIAVTMVRPSPAPSVWLWSFWKRWLYLASVSGGRAGSALLIVNAASGVRSILTGPFGLPWRRALSPARPATSAGARLGRLVSSPVPTWVTGVPARQPGLSARPRPRAGHPDRRGHRDRAAGRVCAGQHPKLVQSGAQILVCGGRKMATGVREALGEALAPPGLTPALLKAEGAPCRERALRRIPAVKQRRLRQAFS